MSGVTPRRLIVCCDGTGQSPRRLHPSNVLRLSRAITPVSADGVSQITYYQWGVGSSGFRDRITGGAFGDGLEQNVEHAYRFLVHNYQPGDSIMLFGFSRGAFTARSLAGMIAACGMLRKEHADKIDLAYESFKQFDRKTTPAQIKERYSHDVEVDFLGVWDTVGSMGVPRNRIAEAFQYYSAWPFRREWVKRLFSKITPQGIKTIAHHLATTVEVSHIELPRHQHAFHDAHLSPLVKRAFHALAIDEKRPTYEPTLWIGDIASDQVVQQRWFAGAHSDIGGNGNFAISARPMRWIVGEAMERCGMEVTPEFWREVCEQAIAQGKVSQSPEGFLGWVLGIGMREERRIVQLSNKTVGIHTTAAQMFSDPSIDYSPPNLRRIKFDPTTGELLE